MNCLRWLFYSVFVTLISGCVILQPPPPAGEHYLSQSARQQQLATLQTWTAKGAMAVRTAERGGSASFDWQQQGNNYTLQLLGPLGTSGLLLTGTPNEVVMQTADNKIYRAATPEKLLRQQVGWDVPISNLHYWIRGIPTPRKRAIVQWDNNNHIVHLQQQGWQIVYTHFLSVDNIDLPTRITLSHPQAQVRIIVKQWNLNT